MDASIKKKTHGTGGLSFGRRAMLAAAGLWALSSMGSPVLMNTAHADDDTTPATTISSTDVSKEVILEPGKATKLSLDHRVKTVKILAEDIADVVPLGASDLLITGKKTGTTQLIVWDDADHSEVIQITVQSAIAQLRRSLAQLFPGSNITAEEAMGTITLHGQVRDLETASQAGQLAAPYGSKVLNLLEIAGGQQVMLRVRFAEVSKDATSALGVNFGFSDGTSFFGNNIGQINPFGTTALAGSTTLQALAASSPNPAVTFFGQGAIGREAFQYFVQALETNNVLQILAEPDLITTSGQEASFLAGGEFPIPVSQGTGSGGAAVTIQYQEYGVKLKFTPIVLGDGRIRLKVNPEVSDLDYTTGVTLNGFTVPGVNKRTVNTTIELAEGQTFAVAGLLQNNVTESDTQWPLLGDLPVLGALFRSVSYEHKKTELVVFVTPVLVNGMNPGEVPALPGEHWKDPSNANLYLFKDMGGDPEPTGPTTTEASAESTPPQYKGDYGFEPPMTASAK